MAIVFTQHEIAAAPAEIVALLDDLAAYPLWNPLFRRVEPKGDGVSVTLHPASLWPLRFAARRAVLSEPTRIVLFGDWLGPAFLSIEHVAELEPRGGTTILRQTARFTGWSQKLYPDWMMRPIRAALASLGEAVRDRLETPA